MLSTLYEYTGAEPQDRFDVVLFAGVLYHVTDPVLALRIVFNCLRDGGVCVVETAITHSDDRILAYEGPRVILGGSREDSSRKRLELVPLLAVSSPADDGGRWIGRRPALEGDRILGAQARLRDSAS